uniref:Uncharacterized protein n=1 Tax=Anguilla anguilla TaxID=7936 RepID=A0A0E9XBD6_ANGAN
MFQIWEGSGFYTVQLSS